MTNSIEADYVVIGAGAMGMAFTDTLLTETEATVAVIDRYHQPGGHWTTAYPFVRLHQPSSFYGVNSRELGQERIDETGWNAGLYELASSGEVCAYFDQVLHQQFLPSGRVQYFPMSEYNGDGQVHALPSGGLRNIRAHRRVVDATYMRVNVPSMRKPPFPVADGVACVPLNDLVKLRNSYANYTVIGAGKTGMDACLWLLRVGVAPAAIRWIMPRDSWLLDRARIQPGPQFVPQILEGMAGQTRAVFAATSVDDFFDRLQACGQLQRLTNAVRPTMYKCATVTQLEVEQLRRIEDVVRLGHVTRIDIGTLVLAAGSLPALPNTLYVDCTADGLERRPAVPVFTDHHITLQSVRTCQQVFSAAFIAHVEAAYADDATRNDLCMPVPHPDSDIDFLRTSLDNARNDLRWAADAGLQAWLAAARLQLFRNLMPAADSAQNTDTAARSAALEQHRAGEASARARITALLTQTAAG